MAVDTVTRLYIGGLRSIEALTLELRGLTVLIGDNGTGKSAIVEACEILRRASMESFFHDLLNIHGGLYSLLRHGRSQLEFAVTVEGDGPRIFYILILAQDGPYTVIDRELLMLQATDQQTEPLLARTRGGASVYTDGDALKPIAVPADQLALTAASGPFSPHPALSRMRRALASIEVHVPFEVTPSWVAKADGRRSEARGEMQLQRVDRLERLGKNLPNVFAALQNEFGAAHWSETMEYVRLGLGQDIETISLRAGAAGMHSLWLKRRDRDEQIPATSLADGVLSYLAFVALFRLPRADRSLLAFDEPELHMHPELLARVLGFFEAMAEKHPVILSTHSDRLLDALSNPEEAVRVCELEQPEARTRLRALDADALSRWLNDYRGLGDVRSAGYLPHVLAETAEEPPAAKDEQGGDGSS